MPQVISQNDFLNCLFDINPNGDPNMAFESLNIIMGKDEKTIDGRLVTFELICKAYKAYCDLWDAKWEGTEARFIPKAEEKKGVWQFLNMGMYKQKFENPKTGRDEYLFGGAKISLLTEQLKNFLSNESERPF